MRLCFSARTSEDSHTSNLDSMVTTRDPTPLFVGIKCHSPLCLSDSLIQYSDNTRQVASFQVFLSFTSYHSYTCHFLLDSQILAPT